MKRLLLAASALMAIATAQAADVERVVKPTPGVTRVIFDTPGELSVRQGNEERLVIEAEPKVLAQLEVTVKGDTLALRSKGSFRTDKGLRYTLTTRSLRSLRSEASGNTSISGYSGGALDVEVAGSGNIALSSVQPTRLAARVTGSGNIEAAGSGTALLAVIESSGTIEAESFRAKEVDARIDGSGTIRVRAEESLNAAIDGSGTIEYAGKPKVKRSVNGAGSIEPI